MIVAFVFSSLVSLNPPSCDEVRRVRAALVAAGDDDASVLRLEQRVCSKPVSAPARTPECEQLLILAALGKQGGGDEPQSLMGLVCQMGKTVPSSTKWGNGQLARNGSTTWYWPNGKLAQNGSTTFYWPNGKLAQNGTTTWYWPNGQLAQNGSTTFYSPEGKLIDELAFYSLACHDLRGCEAIKDFPRQVQMAWMLSLASSR